jgi:hypothetical protein
MNNAEKVTNFLTKNRNLTPICDDCLAEHFVPPINRHDVESVTKALASTPLFKRIEGQCSVCHKTKLVISILEDSEHFAKCPFGCGNQKVIRLVIKDDIKLDDIYRNEYQLLECGHEKFVRTIPGAGFFH